MILAVAQCSLVPCWKIDSQ